MNTRFAAVDARFAAIDARFGHVDGRFTGIEGRLATLDGKLDRHFHWTVALVIGMVVNIAVSIAGK